MKNSGKKMKSIAMFGIYAGTLVIVCTTAYFYLQHNWKYCGALIGGLIIYLILLSIVYTLGQQQETINLLKQVILKEADNRAQDNELILDILERIEDGLEESQPQMNDNPYNNQMVNDPYRNQMMY